MAGPDHPESLVDLLERFETQTFVDYSLATRDRIMHLARLLYVPDDPMQFIDGLVIALTSTGLAVTDDHVISPMQLANQILVIAAVAKVWRHEHTQ